MTRLTAVLLFLLPAVLHAQGGFKVMVDRRMEEQVGRLNIGALRSQLSLPNSLVNRSALLRAEAGTRFLSLAAAVPHTLLNFATREDAEGAEVGLPLYVFEVSRESLQSFRAGVDPATLLPPQPTEWISPIMSGDVARSFIVYARTGDAWEFMSAGNSPETSALMDTRAVARSRIGGNENTYFAVYALKHAFLGFRSALDRAVYLVPIRDDAGLGFEAGAPLPASTVFQALRTQATVP